MAGEIECSICANESRRKLDKKVSDQFPALPGMSVSLDDMVWIDPRDGKMHKSTIMVDDGTRLTAGKVHRQAVGHKSTIWGMVSGRDQIQMVERLRKG